MTPPHSSIGDMPVEQAREQMLARVKPLAEREVVSLREALGRVLAADVISPIDVPANDNSAMDGYAFAGSALSGKAVTLNVVASALAGHPHAAPVGAGDCVRIMTGAVMPEGCDTVIPQELVVANAQSITIEPGSVRAGDNRRRRGEDLERGKVALHAGRVLRPADLGLLASLGIASAEVKRRPRVAYFSTGDELRAPGEALEAGCIYDSNRYALIGLLERLGCEVRDMGVVRDDPATLEAALSDAAREADAIVTSGGASSGDADHTTEVMRRLGDVAFWKLALRPGRPFAFGHVGSPERPAFLFGLPGNPVAAMLSFCFLVRPALLRLMGANERNPLTIRVRAQSPIRKKPGRTEYQRGIVSRDEAGQLQVRLTGAQGSGILRSMSEANCIVMLEHRQGNISVGEAVDVVLVDSLA